MRLQLPFVTRSRYESTRAETVHTAEQLAATTIVNGRLTEDLSTVRAQLAAYRGRRTVSDVLEEHDVHRKALADVLGDQKWHLNWGELIAEVVRLNGAAEAWMADHEAEKKRADQLQARLDDALGLNATAVTAGETWQARRETKMRWDK